MTAAELLVCIAIISVAHPGHAILRRLRDLYDQLPREGSDRQTVPHRIAVHETTERGADHG